MTTSPITPFVDPYRHHQALTGVALQHDIDATPEVRPVYIDELVLEESVVMLASPPGQGKSCLLLTMIAHASAGLPVFGQLRCPRPLRCYVFCPERSARELKERFRKIQRAIPAVMENIVFDDGMTGKVDIALQGSRDSIYREMDRLSKGTKYDIFFIEGLYGMTRLPLAKEETANLFYRFHSEMIARMGCSIWESHHTKKIQRNWKGEELPAEWFGSQFLMANATGAYLFQRLPQAYKSHITMGKDTVSGLASELGFTFDPETFTMEVDVSSEHVSGKERIRIFVNTCLQTGKTFDYTQLTHISKLSQSTLTRTLMTWVKEGKIINVNGNGQKGLYRVLGLV